MTATPHDHMISVRVPDAFALDVDDAAAALGISRSQFMYQACELYLWAVKRASGCLTVEEEEARR